MFFVIDALNDTLPEEKGLKKANDGISTNNIR